MSTPKCKPTGTILDYQGNPTGADIDKPFHENWRQADFLTGVSYRGPWEDPHAGFPEHVRRCARAIDDAGFPVHLKSLDPGAQWQFRFEIGGKDVVDLRVVYRELLTKTIKSYLVEVVQIVPDDELLQRLTIHPELTPAQLRQVNRFKIISTVWERDRISDHAVGCLNRVGQVWVANQQDKKMLERCGVRDGQVEVVPIPFFPSDPHLKLNGRQRTAGPVRFYHIGKWEVRKAHHEMFGAFLMAFSPGDVRFYFKTSSSSPDFGEYPSSPEESVHRWMDDERVKKNGWTIKNVNENIFLIKRRLPASQIVELHRMGDIYLSLSRGEGFDMPAVNSKLAGNLMVYTPSGGPQDFAGINDIRVEPTGKIPCHSFYKWGDAQYLDFSIDEAAEAMRTAVQRIKNGERQRGIDLAPFSADQVGAKMRELIEGVVRCGKRDTEKEKQS